MSDVEGLPSLAELPERLRWAREAAGLGRTALSESFARVGVEASPSSIQRYENPVGHPLHREARVGYVVALARVTGTPIDWILGDAARSAASATAEAMRAARARIEAELTAERLRGLETRAAFARVDARYGKRHRDGTIDAVTWECWLAVRDGATLADAYLPEGEGDDP